MVWHSHMLNPRCFLEDSIRYAKMSLWISGFPWDIINDCINDFTMGYDPGESAKLFFGSKTGLSWENLDDSPDKFVECPRCKQSVPVPWTAGEVNSSVDQIFETYYGFADKTFYASCTFCSTTINHERLKVAKFRKDLKALIEQRYPMPGTFYNTRGVPEAAVDPPSTFPNRLLWAFQRSLVGLNDTELEKCMTVSEIRHRLEMGISNQKEILLDVIGGTIRFDVSSEERRRLEAIGIRVRSRLIAEEKIAFRRMMSRYWENHTPFAIDLVGAVVRQGVFVRKMDEIDWLHSPTVMATMGRLIEKYHVFMRIMVAHPLCMAVPTLDVDLAWHTHQLDPSRYYFHCLSETGNSGQTDRPYFIDHDDKVDEIKLSDGFEWTSKMYRKFTDGGVYSECTCWYCEATRVPDLYLSILPTPSISRARAAADALHDRIPPDQDKNPHISVHNAVTPQRTMVPGPTPRQVKSMLLRNNYEKALRRLQKRNKKQGKQPETNKKAETADDPQALRTAWGYPVFVPFYSPYVVDPSIHQGIYPGNPTCMSFVPGAHGNCAAGTCGGGVAAGSCRGFGVGRCTGGCSGGNGGQASCGRTSGYIAGGFGGSSPSGCGGSSG